MQLLHAVNPDYKMYIYIGIYIHTHILIYILYFIWHFVQWNIISVLAIRMTSLLGNFSSLVAPIDETAKEETRPRLL